MPDPLANAPTWLQLLISSGSGGAVVAGARAFWTWFRNRTEAGDVAKSETIASLNASLVHERTERARERQEAKDSLERLGGRLDAVTAQLERERIQAAGVAVRIRQDSSVDNEWADAMPTAVRDRADLIAPASKVPPAPDPELDARLERFIEGVPTPVPEK